MIQVTVLQLQCVKRGWGKRTKRQSVLASCILEGDQGIVSLSLVAVRNRNRFGLVVGLELVKLLQSSFFDFAFKNTGC